MPNVDVDVNKTYVAGRGPRTPKILIVGESPSYEDIEALKPFVGSAGKFLNALLSEVDINRESCWVTNVVKYFVQPVAKKNPIPFKKRALLSGVNLDLAVHELWEEIGSLKPNLIIGLGGTALWALTGKEGLVDYRGSLLSRFGYKILCTYHPAHVLHSAGESTGYWNKAVMLADLRRARKESEYKDLILPNRRLEIAQNAYELNEFFAQYPIDIYPNPSVDIEAHKCIPICVGISFTPSHGMTIPLWNHYGISNISKQELVKMWAVLADRLAKSQVIGQNLGYDRDKLKRLGFIFKGIKDDTLLLSNCINPELPKNLAFNTSIYTDEPFYKNEGMYEGEVKDLLIGCARDACVTLEIRNKMLGDLKEKGSEEYYRNFLLPLQNVYARIEECGFKVNEEIRKEVTIKYIEQDEELRYRLFKLTGEYINVQSPLQVAKLLYDKLNIPAREGAGEEVLTSIINRTKNEIIKEVCNIILEDRRVRKTINSYCCAIPDFDGRMRTSYFLCLKTGRSSTSQQEEPIRPSIPYIQIEDGKKSSKNAALGMAFQTITKHGEIGPDIRRMLVVDEGRIFLNVDLSQAEARVIFTLADDWEALKLIDEVDYHALTTSWFFGGSERNYSKKVLGYECPQRFIGKTLRHAGHLGAQARRAALTVNTDARKFKIKDAKGQIIQVDEKMTEMSLKIFHARQPKIKQVFHNSVIQCLEKNRTLTSPVPYGIDASQGMKRTFFERWNDDLFREAFGEIPQRTVSEHVKACALRIMGSEEHRVIGRAPWIWVHVESHDALLVSLPIERKLEGAGILREEFERPIDFSKCSIPRDKLVIPCDIEEGYDYYKLSKLKVTE